MILKWNSYRAFKDILFVFFHDKNHLTICFDSEGNGAIIKRLSPHKIFSVIPLTQRLVAIFNIYHIYNNQKVKLTDEISFLSAKNDAKFKQ